MKAGQNMESKNGKYQLHFRNSGLHLSCGTNTVWKYGFSKNEALYFDSEGSTLVLLNAVVDAFGNPFPHLFYKSVVIWNATAGRYPNKLVLQDDGNLVLSNDHNKIMWETNTSGACPAGLKQFILF